MLTLENLRTLAAVSGPCLTIFHPLRMGDPVFEGAVREAERLLTEGGLEEADRTEMLRPVQKIALNPPWKDRSGSLIMFRSPGLTITEFWPDELAPKVHFGKEFFVLPLLAGFVSQRDFWLLALSINNVSLFRGSAKGLVDVPLPHGIAKNLSEDGAFDQPDHSLRGRSNAGPSVGNMKGVQFGTSSAHELRAVYLHDFFRAIDQAIRPILASDGHPLILAAVTRELAIYRKVNTYSPTLAGAVHGSPDSVGTPTLYAKAKALMVAYSANAAGETQRQIEEAANHGLLVTEPVDVIDAASTGKVEQLIVSDTADGSSPRDETINWAALATLRNSGKISILEGPKVATGLAAILRYRTTEQGGDATPATAA